MADGLTRDEIRHLAVTWAVAQAYDAKERIAIAKDLFPAQTCQYGFSQTAWYQQALGLSKCLEKERAQWKLDKRIV